MEQIDHGTIIVEVTTGQGALPIQGASVLLTDLANGEAMELVTDESGRTPVIRVETPPLSASLDPDSLITPYSLFQVDVRKEGYTPVSVRGIQVFSGIETIQPVDLIAASSRARSGEEEIVIEIPPNSLDSSEEREPEGPPSNARILTRVYIPEFITVHLGRPSASARNVRVPFIDYIKNVASSEIYPTWPEAALRANIHAQVGFVLNRVFTEWYPSRGYDFEITNSTAYDQSFVEGRNIFDNISRLVDEIFNVYPRRLGHLEPLFSSYCNGTTTTCSGLSQWGTVSLANQGYNPLQMLQYYSGRDVELVQTNEIRGIERSYPGYLLRRGSRDENVRIIQQQLNRVGQNYPAIPYVAPDGIFGPQTEAAVRKFQQIFDLQQDGIVGRATWYQLSYIYAAVKRLAALNSEGESPGVGTVPIRPYPGYLIREGSRGENVRLVQQYLADLATVYPQIPSVTPDGIFGPRTRAAVVAFQQMSNLAADGIVGPATWDALIRRYQDTF